MGLRYWCVLLCLVGLMVFSTGQTRVDVPLGRGTLWVMTYNVHNLFDAEHDEGKLDGFYLPTSFKDKVALCAKEAPWYQKNCLRSNWVEEKVTLKLNQIKKLFHLMGGRPDVLGIQEVENEGMVKRLAQALGYEHFVFQEGGDERGIDVAIFYRAQHLKLLDYISRAPYGSRFGRPTRDVLAAFFEVHSTGDTLAVYLNHWPSQASPASKRMSVARKVREFIDDDKSKFPKFHALVMGDFNVIDEDLPHAFNSVLMSKRWENRLEDLLQRAEHRTRSSFPLGTYFYAPLMKWNHLDRIFVSQNLLDDEGLDARTSSYTIHTTKTSTGSYFYSRRGHFNYGSVVTGVPKRYNVHTLKEDEAGFSDHFPVSVRLKM